MKRKSLTDVEGNVRELTQKDMHNMKSASEVLPTDLFNVLPKRKPGQRGRQKMPTKVPLTLRYSEEVVNYFRKTGEGWQTRMDEALKEWIKIHPHA